MDEYSTSSGTNASGLGAHWRGHVMLFPKRSLPRSDAAGLRLLVIFFLLEGVLGPRLSLLSMLHVSVPPPWLRIPMMLSIALLAIRFFARVNFSDMGLYRWRSWSATEKSYFLQVLVIANVVFIVILAGRLQAIIASHSAFEHLWSVFLPNLLWGFYQELLYRGILQAELIRRFSLWPGIIISNLAYTFGPLHFCHFARGASAIPMFAAIFAIGLFFGFMFHRSGNLWLPAIFHGIGNMYIEGTQGQGQAPK